MPQIKVISDELLSKIYSDFDRNGIKGNVLSGVRITVTDKIHTQRYRDIVPDLSRFGIDTLQAEQLIKDYIYETTHIVINDLNDIDKLRSINGLPFILTNGELYCLAMENIPFGLTFYDHDKTTSLGFIKVINGTLGFQNSLVTDLGELREVKGDFWIGGTNELTSLSKLEKVTGNLNIKYSKITDLGNLTHVGGSLNIRHREPFSLGKLNYVGDNIMISKKYLNQFDTSKVNISGKVKYFTDK